MLKKTGLKICISFLALALIFTLVPVNVFAYNFQNDSYISQRSNNNLTNLNGSPNLQRAGSGDENPRIFVHVNGSNRSLHVTNRTQSWHGVDILRNPLQSGTNPQLVVGSTIQVNGRAPAGTVMELGGVNNAANSWPRLTTATANGNGQFSLNLTVTQDHINNNPDGFRIRTSTATVAFHIDQIYVRPPSGGGGGTPAPAPSPQPPQGGGGTGGGAINMIHNWNNVTQQRTGQGTSGRITNSGGMTDATFNLATGNFSAQWTTTQAGNRHNNLHGVGWRQGSPNRTIGYNVGALNHTSGHQGMTIAAYYGWTRNPLVEWYVIDNWLNHRSTPGTHIGTFTSDGGTYEVWRASQHGHHINGYGAFTQIKSVRTQVAPLGQNRTITFRNHVDAWARFGTNLTNADWYYQVFIIEGWESNGSGNATVWPQ